MELTPWAIGQQTGVRFVLRGSVCKRSHLIRIGVTVTDTVSGANLWADHYERDLERAALFEIEDDIIQRVVTLLADPYGVIPRALMKDICRKPAFTLTPYEAMLYYFHYLDVVTASAQTQARTALAAVLEHDPEHALALAAMADLHVSDYLNGFEQFERPLERADDLARRAMILDPHCHHAYMVMGQALFAQSQREACVQALEQCLQREPNRGNLYRDIGFFLAQAGEWERGLSILQRGMSLDPRYPSWYHVAPTFHAYRQGDYEMAYAEARRIQNPNIFWDPLLRAASLGQLGRHKEAAVALQNMHRLLPSVPLLELIRRVFFSDENAEMLMDGLHRAGLKQIVP